MNPGLFHPLCAPSDSHICMAWNTQLLGRFCVSTTGNAGPYAGPSRFKDMNRLFQKH